MMRISGENYGKNTRVGQQTDCQQTHLPHQISNHEFDGCEQHNCDESHLIQETNDTDTQRTAVYTHKKISFTNPLTILSYSNQSKN